MSSFCIGSISWCYLAVPLLCCSFHVPLFHGIRLFRQCSIVPPVFRCSARIPVFPSVFRCSTGAPRYVVPCSGVPGFIVGFELRKLGGFPVRMRREDFSKLCAVVAYFGRRLHIAMNIAYEIRGQCCHEYSVRNIGTIKKRIN